MKIKPGTLIAIGVAILFVGLPLSFLLGLYDPWDSSWPDQFILAGSALTLVFVAGITAIVVGLFLLLARRKGVASHRIYLPELLAITSGILVGAVLFLALGYTLYDRFTRSFGASDLVNIAVPLAFFVLISTGGGLLATLFDFGIKRWKNVTSGNRVNSRAIMSGLGGLIIGVLLGFFLDMFGFWTVFRWVIPILTVPLSIFAYMSKSTRKKT